jgi:hypothetical protein
MSENLLADLGHGDGDIDDDGRLPSPVENW